MKTVRKSSTRLLDENYNTPNTSLLLFEFPPQDNVDLHHRLQKAKTTRHSLSGKDIYTFDGFFTEEEGDIMRTFSKNATFSRNSYGSKEAVLRGEKPARSMNGKERWQFFSSPPSPVDALYALFSIWSHRLNAQVITLPWELCDAQMNGSPSIIGNWMEEVSSLSMELGKHRDCDPHEKISFAIPTLYGSSEDHFPPAFVNGAQGHPWIITVMLYATEEAFLPEYGMGTIFYCDEEKESIRVRCQHMRLVLFSSDLIHSIEESLLPHPKTWRISYVFKLIFNPRHTDQHLPSLFSKLL